MARARVLVVEDDPDLAEVTGDLLRGEGYLVTAARHGRQALELLDAGLAPDVIVLDLMMPELDGFGFLKAYRGRPAPHAAVIAVSAFEPYLPEALRAGATAALAKPYAVDALFQTITAVRGGEPPPLPPPAPHDDERARLHAVLSLGLSEAPTPGGALDAYAERVAAIYRVPICLVSIVTADRQLWQGACGLPGDLAAARGGPREDSFCTHAVAARAALVVQDAIENPFFRSNWFVRERGVRFYAGVPLMGRAGESLGTLCLLDFKPQRFGYFDLELLGVLARRVVAELERREWKTRPLSPPSAFRSLADWDPELDVLGRETFADALLVESLRAVDRGERLAVAVVVVPATGVGEAAQRLRAAFPRALVGRLRLDRLGVLVPDAAAADIDAACRNACGLGCRVLAADVPKAPGVAPRILQHLEDSARDGDEEPSAA